MFSFFRRSSEESAPPKPGWKARAGFIARAAVAHVGALSSLFVLELGEYARQARKCAVLAVVAAFLLVVGYVSFCVCAVLWLGPEIGYVPCLALLGGAHLVAGLVVLGCAVRQKPGPLLRDTCEELKTDYECLRMMIEENRKS